MDSAAESPAKRFEQISEPRLEALPAFFGRGLGDPERSRDFGEFEFFEDAVGEESLIRFVEAFQHGDDPFHLFAARGAAADRGGVGGDEIENVAGADGGGGLASTFSEKFSQHVVGDPEHPAPKTPYLRIEDLEPIVGADQGFLDDILWVEPSAQNPHDPQAGPGEERRSDRRVVLTEFGSWRHRWENR